MAVQEDFDPNKIPSDVVARAGKVLKHIHDARAACDHTAEQKWSRENEYLAQEAGVSPEDLLIALAARVVLGK